jgi:hypothetical protein
MNCLHRVNAILLVLVAAGLSSGERQPQPKVEVLEPAAGDVLGGMVDVRLMLPGELAGPVYAGLGGPPWTKLEQVGEPNEYCGLLDSKMVPNGEQRLIVKTRNKRADTAVAMRVKNPLKIYFADLHSHCGYSDGTILPMVAHDYARHVAKLDVFSLTDHLEQVDNTEWLDMRESAWDASEDGVFVALPGLEWTKKIGHINIIDPLTRRWPLDLGNFYQAAADAEVICKFNHPGDGTEVYNGLAYSKVGDRAVQLMEVRRETEEKAYIRALKKGWHIAPDGADDTHGPNWGSRLAWSGILAPGLSKRNVLHALRHRHCYSTLDRDCLLRFKVNGATMGDIVADPIRTVRVTVSVNDPDADDVTAKIELFEDGVVVATDEPNAARRRWQSRRDPEPGEHYYFAKVIQKDGNMLWSAPIWVTVGGK